MKRTLRIWVLSCILSMLFTSSALAQASAIPNQSLSFRTGPNTRYSELFTLPESTQIVPLALEEGNDVTWVLCEFQYNDKLYQGYTGQKRMKIYGGIPRANPFFLGGIVLNATTVYSAPSSNAAQAARLNAQESILLLQCSYTTESDIIPPEAFYLDFSLDYAYIEYYDAAANAPARGWVLSNDVASTDVCGGYVTQDCLVYSEKLDKIGALKQNEIVSVLYFGYGQFPDYAAVGFYDRQSATHLPGYIPLEKLHIYE